MVGSHNITEYIEPSAGAGVFLDFLDKPYIAYDIEPEDERIIKQDWLTVDLDYKKGRCIIGNPPYGEKNLLSMKFFRKAIEVCDYIAFILPISQWNNNQQMFQFDLMYSENLGVRTYSDREVHCCFNIFKRPEGGVHCSPNTYPLNDITIKEVRASRKQFLPKDFKYDIGICSWGDVGKIIKNDCTYVKETYIRINNKQLKEKVVQVLSEARWREIYPMTTAPNLTQWQIRKYLKEQIPELN